MKNINTLLTKMKTNTSDMITLNDLAPLSLHEIYALSEEKLSWHEAKTLYKEAKKAAKISKINEAHYLARRNPQVQNAVSLGIQSQAAHSRALGDWIPNRGDTFVDSKSVASMFSPAGYLTELYREAKALHAESSLYHLDKRRPDLAQLVLSQENMDKEISTLSLSNQILTTALQNKLGSDKDLYRELATNRLTGETPYHQPYETIRQAILLQDKKLEGLMSAPDIIKTLDSALLASIQSDISPELYNILIEDVDKDTDALVKKNFGDINSSLLNSARFIAQYYDIELKEAQFAIKAFNKENMLSNKELLNLNKIIRLYKATEMPLLSVLTAIKSKNALLNIDKETLSAFFHLQVIMKTYPVTVEQAIVLNGGLISKISLDNSPSQFEQLFNSPPLNGYVFIDDGESINFYHEFTQEELVRINILKRAFNVNDIELKMLWYLTYKVESVFNCDLHDISLVYRLHLLAQIHGLSVNELLLLIDILPEPFNGSIKSDFTSDELGNLIYTINEYTQFAKKEKWTISELFLICSQKYDVEYSSELGVLIENLKGILKNTSTHYDKQFSAVASFIAAEMGADSIEKVNSILNGVNLEKDGESLKNILPIITQDNLTNKDKETIAKFFNRIKKNILVSNKIGLNKYELEIINVKNDCFYPKGNQNLTLDRIKHITAFHHFISQCGNRANEFLTELKNQSLTTEKMASILNIDEKTLTQALALTPTKALKDFKNITILIQYLELSKTLSISPSDFKLLVDLKYVKNNDVTGTYDNWNKLSQIMQAGLNSEKTAQLVQIMDERKAVVLTHYYAKQNNDISLISRDDVYHHLLIDNQVSAEIITTPIAQAIANLQFYINNCLSGDEKDVDKNVKGRTFFAQWDEFNKRYSTWAGVSKLVYYPENYVDPTVRIGQTKMMDTLLQSISQNSVNSDTVEYAFKTYLTSFEQIANLDVISGYHDSVTLDDGITYFIGRNPAEQMSYYWRSADHSKIKDGKMAANAWTEWTKIENGLNPYNGLIRPVIFNSRLYIAWVERVEKAKNEMAEKIEKEIQYSLKLSHIRYDGSWSSPIDILLKDIFNNENYSFHVSYNEKTEQLLLTFYQITKIYDQNYKDFSVVFINGDMSYEIKGSSKKEASNIYDNVYVEFDIVKEEKIERYINNRFVIRKEISYSIDKTPAVIEKNTNDYISLKGSNVTAKVLSENDDSVELSVDASINCYINQLNESSAYTKRIFYEYFKLENLDDSFEDIIYISGNMSTVDEKYPNDNFIKTPIDYYLAINKKTKRVFIITYNNNENRFINKNDLEPYLSDNSDAMLSVTFQSANNSFEYYGFDCTTYKYYGYEDFPEDKLGLVTNILTNHSTFLVIKMVGIENKKIILHPYRSYNDAVLSDDVKFQDIPLSNGDISDIIIELSSEDSNNIKRYKWSEWDPNYSPLVIGNNRLHSKAGVLNLNFPHDEFASDGKTVLNINIEVVDKNSTLLVNSTYSLGVNKLTIQKKENNIITLKKNAKSAQYLSMDVKDKKMLVRLNTLFAHQLVEKANVGINTILTLDTQRLPEPALEGNTDDTMDFNGANALYFWELFYYTPMMVANVMLEGHNYDEASRWLRYVFSPNGYIENGVYSGRVWNSQPLLNDTNWDKDQLDSTDPDAVAQTDPMHYKLATFMKCLDILMERGDSAYRLLETDTLNEAKMWYMQALKLLGAETEQVSDAVWSAPKLIDAASKTTSTRVIYDVCEDGKLPRTANSLTELFLPQINEKLAQYHGTLKTRLFNLRHNLSIDGQPLSLPIYATPADPKALQNAAVNQSQGGSALPNAVMPTQRFPVILNNAKSVVSQLMQFGSSISSIAERQDAQALSELLTTQGSEMILQNMKYQTKNIEEFTYNEKALKALRVGAQNRFDHYGHLYDENISTSEQQAMDLYLASSVLNTASQGLNIAGAAADLVPNIYGLAVGGSRLGAIFNATSIGLQLSGAATRIAADRLNQSEFYLRRREEWKIARDSAKAELEQIDAQLDALQIRKEAASLQLDSMKLQQQHTQEHLTFLQNKFTNKALYSWLHGKLMAIYKPFYDLTVSRCRMAEMAYQYDLGETQTFIRPGAWQGNYSGLMAGESLMHNLTEMESSYLEKDKRMLEITKIVSLDDVYQGLGSNKFGFEQVADVINKSKTQLGTAENGITLKNGQLQASIKLSDLAIGKDYPADLGKLRRVKQISVTLPALTGAYQNIRAVLNYGGSAVKPRGCSAIAISHGMNDSGQFQLNFNDDRYLPFEGLPVDDTSTLTLSFPDATDKQKAMLLTLNDIILHINYTIR